MPRAGDIGFWSRILYEVDIVVYIIKYTVYFVSVLKNSAAYHCDLFVLLPGTKDVDLTINQPLPLV